MFWEKFEKLCAMKGILPGTACRLMGLSNSVSASWKKGVTPRYATCEMVAEFFGVNVQYLLSNSEQIELESSYGDDGDVSTTFWININRLCNERGIYPSTVCHELGLTNAAASAWKRGSIPKRATLAKLAEYFNVTEDYLLYNKIEAYPKDTLAYAGLRDNTPEESSMDAEKQDLSAGEIMDYLSQLKDRHEMRMLFSVAKNATKEDIERAVAIIEALKK